MRLIAFAALFWLIHLGATSAVLARPEYAVKEKLNCVSCHMTPWGGGPRNIMGKAYGSRGLGSNKLTALDAIYADLRLVGYYPVRTTESSNGVALMEAAVTGSVPVTEGSDGDEMRGVLTYNMAPLSSSQVREAYLRWQLGSKENPQSSHFLLGRFYVPFGLLTDEHRTYTRIQTNMTLNNYDVGAAFSTNLSADFHLDLVVVNDFQTGGVFTSNDLTLGMVLNLRWNPRELPFLLGISGNLEKVINQPLPYASSVYTGISLDRLTSHHLGGAVLFERVDANHWNNPAINTGMVNPSLSQFFIPSSSAGYLAFINSSSSLGYYGQVRFDLSNQWTLFYKFDYLALDRNFLDDAYVRHGIGFETHFNSNLILNVRYEKAVGMRPEIATSTVLAAQDDVFAMLRVWL